MADQLPINFQIPAEGAIASYDWTDVSSGTGFINFYLGYIDGSYVLTNYRFYSDKGYVSAPTAVATTVLDLDFDVLINKPIILQGKAIFNVPILINGASIVNLRTDCYIRKWNGVTETEIANTQGTAVDFDTAPYNVNNEAMTGGIITVPLTKFKIGEYLRVTIQVVVTESQDKTIWVGFDPGDVNIPGFVLIPSASTIQIPVKVEL